MSKNDTTNFQDWLSAYGPETKQDAFDLYDAVTTASPCGRYDASGSDGKVFVSVPSEPKLAILGSAAKQAFMKVLDSYNPFPDMGWEGAKEYHRSMSKDD
ncbi:hypothetical protein TL5118_04062 [Thalassovita autumnalis]|uniref:Uncharacterized protein n=1 Tax=Thalassovita autumnalis TaxID=2072972 RepID=A0A0P1FPA7_9RHOB|nr:hypothetical protein [Thalassovita autumnalis]CUH70087.1 hypothetical protein TL5118_04062 [Thalassovita autumnalis]CUH70761.1 hypothetical protein TL5120_00541 [Thalassovita autumnalis]